MRGVVIGAAAVVLLPACAGDDTAMPPTTTTTYPVAADVPLVLARHQSGVVVPYVDWCTAWDYVAVPDGSGGMRADYRNRSPEGALQQAIGLPGGASVPPRGYHWVPGDKGGGTFVYASGGEVGATVTVEESAGLYGVTDTCGGATGPPDPAWRP